MQGIVESSRKHGHPKSQSFNNISDLSNMDANPYFTKFTIAMAVESVLLRQKILNQYILRFRVMGLKVKVSLHSH